MQPKTVDEYIALQPAELREPLELIRHLIRKTVPKAEEKISYGICGYHQDGLLVGFGARKNGTSLYLCSGGIRKKMGKALDGYAGTLSAIHLPAEKKLPVTLLKKIITLRIAENKLKAAKKKAKKKTA